MTANESPMKAGGALSMPPSAPVRAISSSKLALPLLVLSSCHGTANRLSMCLAVCAQGAVRARVTRSG